MYICKTCLIPFVEPTKTCFRLLETCFSDCGGYSIYKRVILLNMDSKEQFYLSKLNIQTLKLVKKDNSTLYTISFLFYKIEQLFLA